MMTTEEKDFLVYWKANREKKKRSFFQYTIGLPMGVLIIVLLFVNIISGWHKRAASVLQSNGSLIITILVASIAIVVFITVFSVRHKWEQHEQRYRELLFKQEKESAAL